MRRRSQCVTLHPDPDRRHTTTSRPTSLLHGRGLARPLARPQATRPTTQTADRRPQHTRYRPLRVATRPPPPLPVRGPRVYICIHIPVRLNFFWPYGKYPASGLVLHNLNAACSGRRGRILTYMPIFWSPGGPGCSYRTSRPVRQQANVESALAQPSEARAGEGL